MTSKTKKVIYTCIAGDYDGLFNHQYVSPEWEYICFSDSAQPSDLNSSWRILPLKHKMPDGTRTNRWHKINAHLCLKDYKYSIYIDANIDVLSKEFFDAIDEQRKRPQAFSLMSHPARDCVYDELDACIQLQKDDPAVMKSQIKLYKEAGYPRRNGLYASSILYREHLDETVIRVMEEWWGWLTTYSKRDQLSLPYALWKRGYKPGILPFTYGLGRFDPLFFYPHSDALRDYVRQLYDEVQALESKQKLTENQLKSTEERLLLIEQSKTWRARNRIRKFLYKG